MLRWGGHVPARKVARRPADTESDAHLIRPKRAARQGADNDTLLASSDGQTLPRRTASAARRCPRREGAYR